MSYVLEAVIGAAAVLSAITRQQPSMVVVPLRQGFGLVPMTSEVRIAVDDGTPPGLPVFWKLPGGFDSLLCSWSARGPVAYVEAEFFGGAGTQAAALWEAGELAFGPVLLDEGEDIPASGTPISRALARLGVVRGDHYDEFDAAGLSWKRDTRAWLSLAG